jgi:uncharacterized LabA/DUF88 family protein
MKKAEIFNAYIDGFNLYFGLKEKGWKQYYWMDVEKLCLNLLRKNQYLKTVHYFTSRIRGDSRKQKRQTIFLEALQVSGVVPIKGKYRINDFTCNKCKKLHKIPAEKMTDVGLAVQMLVDGYSNAYDAALVISGDTDLIPVIKAIKRHFHNKRVIMAFPPERYKSDFEGIADDCWIIGERACRESQLPDIVVKPDGYELKRPIEWT